MQKPIVLQLDEFLMTDSALSRLHEAALVQLTSVEDILSLPEPKAGVAGLLVNIPHPVQAPLLDKLPDLRIIANYGVGYDHIDVEAATARGIWVSNAPGILDKAVADVTLGLIIAACRRLMESHQTMAQQAFTGWSPMFQLGVEVTGKTLGLVGMGEIGKQVAKRAKGFDMPVNYYQRHPLSAEQEATWGVTYCDFETLLATSDIISIHIPLTSETRHLFNAMTLACMKPGSVLINTSRGPIIDEPALAQALKSGHLYAAGLDVFEQEPLVCPELLHLPNVVMSAHIASASYETRQRMGDATVDNLLLGLRGEPPVSPLNQPRPADDSH